MECVSMYQPGSAPDLKITVFEDITVEVLFLKFL